MHRFLLPFLLALAGCSRGAPESTRPTTSGLPDPASAPRVPARSPELARRADSLGALDPEREAAAAAARGDFRFASVCGYVCAPPGLPVDSVLHSRDSLAFRSSDSARAIVGTSDAVLNDDVARLNDVATKYAARYNRAIWARRSRRQASRPAT